MAVQKPKLAPLNSKIIIFLSMYEEKKLNTHHRLYSFCLITCQLLLLSFNLSLQYTV